MQSDIIDAYSNSSLRLFLLDYDGTLANIMPTPPEAKPTPEIIDLLGRLSRDPHNTVVIVSGRNHEELETWLGMLPLAFAAEHGLICKDPDGKWQAAKQINTRWKTDIRAIMEGFVARTDGTFIEEKTDSLVWHYRVVTNGAAAEQAAQELSLAMAAAAERHGLRVMHGSKILEVQPLNISKALAASHWLGRKHWDFVLAAGDDTTDEDLFQALPVEAHTIKVGEGMTAARHRLATPEEFRGLLRNLVGSS